MTNPSLSSLHEDDHVNSDGSALSLIVIEDPQIRYCCRAEICSVLSQFLRSCTANLNICESYNYQRKYKGDDHYLQTFLFLF
jgi:hypothetical protein